jgi:histidinol phosphatase-like PHP family hydrolase
MIGEAIYDLDELAAWNMHIHTTFSGCAKPEMKIAGILQEARRAGLKQIAITDHYNSADVDRVAQIKILRAELLEEGLDGPDPKILYGAELSAYGVGKFLDTLEVNAALEYRLYSYNHYHLDFWEHPEDKSPKGYVDHALRVLTSLFAEKRADSIAHPFIGRFIRCYEDRTLVTQAIRDSELGDIMTLGTVSGSAWELNLNSILADPVFGRRYWRTGREVNAVFHLATDAHRLSQIDPRNLLGQVKSVLL